MKKIWKIIITILVALISIFIVLTIKYGPNFNFYLIPPSSEKYGSTALDKIDKNGLYANTKEWEVAKQEAYEGIKKSSNYDETIAILEKALLVGGGKHSFIEEAAKDLSNSKEIVYPTSNLSNNVLYITVPEFSGNEQEGKKYAEIILEAIYKNEYKGIVLDFSNNRGGDMGPMISALSPILPDGKLISFIDRNENERAVNLKNGVLSGGGTPIKINYNGKVKNVPIAIIIGDQTGSSGEVTALCFKGLKNMKYFGGKSAGYTTANSQFSLYDGRVMQITSEKLKTINGEVYDNEPIVPDVEIKTGGKDAEEWINSF